MTNQGLVLDIPFKAITNWMQDRRLLPTDWVKKLRATEIKSEELRTNFPASHQEESVRKIKQFIQEKGDNFIYRDAKEVFRRLTQTTEEGKLKSFLGQYKSQLVKDWQLLLRIYESDNLYLAEYGKIVQQVHGFDTPSMKRQMQSMCRQINESGQRQQDFKRSIVDMDNKFKDECKKLGIVPTTETSALEQQVLGLVEQLIDRFRNLEELLQQGTIGQLIQYYDEFNRDLKNEGILAMLKHLNQYGDENIALYEYRKLNPGKPVPKDLELREKHKYDLYKRFYQIYTGESGMEVANSGTIEIDWNNIDTNYIESSDSTAQQTANESSQTWTVIEDTEGKTVKDIDLKKQDDPNTYNEEETLVYNTEYRQQLTTDLEECEFFLRQRLVELNSKDQAAYSLYQESLSRKEILKQCDQAVFVQDAIALIEKINHQLNNKEILQLMLLRWKPKVAISRIEQKLYAPLKLKEKYANNIVSYEKKQKEMAKEVEQLKMSIERDERTTKELVETIQTELSGKLKAAVKVNL